MGCMNISDGTGGGNSAKVDSDNRLATVAVTEERIYRNAEDKGQAYSWTNADYDYDALDTILLVKNTGTGTLHVREMVFYSDTTTVAHIHRPTTEVTPTGTAVTGTNLNGNSNNVAAATAIGDETNNTQGTILFSIIVPADTPVVVDTANAVLIATNQSIGIDYVTAGTGAICTIVGWFEEHS